MVRLQDLLLDRQRQLQEGFSRGVLALREVKSPQVVEACGQAWIFWPERFYRFYGSFKRLLRLGVVTIHVRREGGVNVALPALTLAPGVRRPKGQTQQARQ